MAFEGLSEKLNATFKHLRGKGRLSEEDIKLAMREVRLALLEADVSYKVVKDFVKNVKEGDIIVANMNFGCGSSREHAPIAIKASGISCVIASTFARIFYRNAINIGLAILECDEAAKDIENGNEVEVDFDTGVITNVTKGCTYKAEPFPEFIKDIINKGGLLNSLKK